MKSFGHITEDKREKEEEEEEEEEEERLPHCFQRAGLIDL